MLTTQRASRLNSKETIGCTFVAVAPKKRSIFFDTQRSTCLEVELIQDAKGHRFNAASACIALEARPVTTFKQQCLPFGPTAMFLLARLEYCTLQIFENLKRVMHDVKLQDTLPRCVYKTWLYIHRHCFDRLTLQVRHLNQSSGIAVTISRNIAIYFQTINTALFVSKHTERSSIDQNNNDRTSKQTIEIIRTFNVGENLKHLNDKVGHQRGRPTVALRQEHTPQIVDCFVVVLDLSNAGPDGRLKLTYVQVTSFWFSPAVDVDSFCCIAWVSSYMPAPQNIISYLNDYALVHKRKVEFF